MKRIRDPVKEKYIEIEDEYIDLLDTQEMQNLRYISQLGVVEKVYPSATHSRFAHSIGVFDTVKQFIKSLHIEDEAVQRQLKIAGLLHDVGHGAFSHNIEAAEGVPNHETKSIEIIQEFNTRGLIRDEDVEPVIEYIQGNRQPNIIANDIDADRIDYLQRDSHYTGISHGSIDADTIIQTASLSNGEIVFDKTAVEAIENLFLARKNMYQSVYFHPTVVCAEIMLATAIEESSLDPESIHTMNDRELHSKLITDSSLITQKLYNKLVNRQLYKEYDAFTLPEEKQELKNCKQQLESSNMEWYDWFIIQQKPTTSPTDIQIDIGNELVQYTNSSSIDPTIISNSYLPDVRIFINPDCLDNF
jgi:HD superfamily phosphohydrolase